MDWDNDGDFDSGDGALDILFWLGPWWIAVAIVIIAAIYWW
jgi:hypothetical protein